MKIEMHAHTSEASPCANVSATKIPALYQKAGYDAIVITDHYCKWAQDRSGLTDNDDYVQYFLNGYRSARKAAGRSALRFFSVRRQICRAVRTTIFFMELPKNLSSHTRIFMKCLCLSYTICATTTTFCCFRRIHTEPTAILPIHSIWTVPKATTAIRDTTTGMSLRANGPMNFI